MSTPITVTEFLGQAENPHIGSGTMVGVDLYTVKGVARLSRKMENKASSVLVDFPKYIAQAKNGHLFVQGDNGNIYRSTDNGDTWTILTGNTLATGRGLQVWEDYLFSFRGTTCDVYGPISGVGAWTNDWWVGTAGLTALQGGDHVAFVNPSLNFLYICNGRYIAYIQLSGPTATFAPGTSTTYIASDKAFIMPEFYTAVTMSWLPPNQIGIAVSNSMNNSQADIVIWDGTTNTTASNVVSLPGAAGPVTQMLTKNGIMYGITDKEHGIYTINGSSAQNVDRLALRMSSRTAGGAQNTIRAVSSLYPHGADFLGPELLTGGNNTPQFSSQASSTGLYPYGIWSVNIEDKVVNTRFPLSHGDILALYTTTYRIGFVKTVTTNAVLVGWQKDSTFGIDKLNASNYITDANTVFVESSLYEVGTRTLPRTFEELEYNLIQPLKTGEVITWYWRKSLADDYQQFHVENLTTTGGALSDIISPLPFGSVQYIQIGFKFNSDAADNRNTPQIRSMILRSNDDFGPMGTIQPVK